MITKHTTRYHSYYKASPLEELPIALMVTDYTLTKIHFDCDEKFSRAVGFLDRRAGKMGSHPVRQKYRPIGNFHKIHIDKRNQKIYLVKQTYKKRLEIIV